MLGVVTGAWAAYVQYSNAKPLCTGCAQPNEVLTIVWVAVFGLLLLVDSLVSLAGFRASFLAGAILAVLVLLVTVAYWGQYPRDDSASIAAMSVLTALVDFVASRPARGLAEKDSPLNLPVFG